MCDERQPRRTIGMVTQDTSLLHRSVRDNIRCGALDATEADRRCIDVEHTEPMLAT
jgi:ATP-binding cassette subfamily B multidrug efflux pump